MKRKSAGPSFSRRPSFNKKRKLDKAGRTRQRNQRVALLALLFLLALTGIIILVVYHDQRNKQAARTVSEAENTDSSGLQQWMEQGAPYIDVQLLTPNEYSRPQLPLNEVDYIAIHYTANPGATAQNNRDYFENLATTHEAKVSSHFVVGLDGEIIQCVPTWEIAYASNERNHDTVSIECCHPDETGEFTEETYASAVQLTAFLCRKYDLTADAVIRHYDVTGKDCPRYFVQNEDAWKNFREDVARVLAKGGSDEAGKENGERKG